MPPAEKKGDVIDALLKGGGGGPPPAAPAGEPDGDEGKEGGMDDPAYASAFQEYQDNPSKETFWQAVKACMGSY